MVFSFEENIIKQLKEYRFDAVAFYDDWGTQDNLIISPEMWREFFKPRYEKQFKIAHQHGLDIYFHSCGYIYDIIPDFIEIGVDMLNLSQPNIFDIKRPGKDFSGKSMLCLSRKLPDNIHYRNERRYI
jgi:uroporphyrinogen decarboxylase